MRKIISKEDKEKKDKKNQLIIGSILMFILIFGTIGYAFNRDSNNGNNQNIEYNGIEFIKNNGKWYFELNKVYSTTYNPEEINISFNIEKKLNDYKNKPLYLVGGNDEARYELLSNLNGIYSRYQDACLEDCEEDFPIKNCSDNIIIFQKGDNKIYQEDNCVFIQGDEIKSADAFLFKILDIT